MHSGVNGGLRITTPLPRVQPQKSRIILWPKIFNSRLYLLSVCTTFLDTYLLQLCERLISRYNKIK